MEMDGLDCVKCQKIKKRDMMGIMGIVNDNKMKDEQCHLLHFEHKNVQWLGGWNELGFCDF